MKRTKLMVAFILLFALLSFGYVQAAWAEEANGDAEATEELDFEAQRALQYPFQDFPADAYPKQTTAGGAPQTRVDADLFHAKFEGDEVAGSGGAVGGAYHFIAEKTDGESWHVKLEANYPTVAGRDYFVTYRFTSDVAGTVKFGDFQEFQIQEGENTVTGAFTAKDSTSYLDLQLGLLPAFTIDFTEIEVKEYADEVTYENALPKPINFERESRVYEKHDQGYDTILVRGTDAINVNYESIPLDLGVWKSRLYVKTGVVPEPGTHYRVTADVMSDRYERNIPFEVLLNDGEVEKGYGALYGQELVPHEVKTCEAVITGNGNGDELILQFSLGEARGGSVIIVGNVHVDKIVDQYTNALPEGFALDTSVATGEIIEEQVPVSYTDIPLPNFFYSGVDTVYEQHDDGYVVNLKEGGSSATLDIVQAPANEGDRGVWKAKLYAATGVSLDPGKSYRIQFDVDSARDQADYEVCFDGDSENAYGALYGRSLTAGGTDHIDMLVTPKSNLGPLTLRLQLGKTDSAAGNSVTLKNLSVESVDIEYKNVLPASFSYDTGASEPQEDQYESVLPSDFSYKTGVNVREQHDEGYTQEATADGKSATLAITEAPEADRGVWKSKLYINTGATPEAGKKYAVSFDVAAEKNQGDYEVCFDGGKEEAYGASKGLSLSAGETQTVNYYFSVEESDGPLVLRFQLGKTDDKTGNTITVSNLKVCPVTDETTEIELPDFAYPMTTPEITNVGSFELESNSGAEAKMTGDGNSAKATIIKSGADWNIKFYAKPGIELEADTAYKISFNVTGADGCTACYKNTATGAEDGFGTEAISGGTVTHEVTPSENGTLEILLKIGTVPAGSEVTVSGVTIEKDGPATETVDVDHINYWVNAEAGAAAEMSGATTAKVVTPGDDWHIKFYAKPYADAEASLKLEAGNTYQVSLHVTNASGCPVCFKNADTGDETGFGVVTLDSDDQTVIQEITPDADGVLEIMLKLGTLSADTEVTISDVQLTKSTTQLAPIDLSDFAYPVTTGGTEKNSFDLEANNGAAAELTGDGESATATVTTPGDDWHVKFYAKPSIELEAGKTYQISFDVENASGCVACYKRVSGEETDFGTEDIADGTVTHVVTPTESGTLEVLLKLGTVPAGTEVKVSNVKVDELVETEGDNLMKDSLIVWAPVHEWADAGYETELSNTDSSATMKLLSTPSDKADWKLKLFVETGAKLMAQTKYRIRYNLQADKSFNYNVFYNNGAEEKAVGEFYNLTAGAIEHVVTAANDAVLNIQLMLGTSDAPNSVTVSNVQVDKIVGSEGSSAVTPINAFVLDGAGYAANLSNTDSSASIAITSVPTSGREPWKVKLFAETGAQLEAGKTYRVSVDVKATNPMSYDLCFNNQEHEAQLGALYGQEMSTGKSTVTYNVTPGQDSVLFLQLNLGNATGANTVTISGIKVEEVSYASAKNVIAGFRFDSMGCLSKGSDDGYVTSLEKHSSSATFRIKKAPAERHAWNAKVIVDTGVTPKAGLGYRITFDLDAAKSQNLFELFCDGNEELAYGALYEQYLAAGHNTISYTIMPGDSKGPLTLQLRFGETNDTSGNTYTISNFTLEEVEFVTAYNPEIKETCVNDTQDGYTAALKRDPNKASVQLLKTPTPEEGLEAWKNKLFVYTGVVFEPDQKYRVSFNVKSIVPAPFEVCYNKRDEEKGLGAIFGLTSLPEGKYVEYTTYAKESAQLVIQLSLGNCTAPNTIFLSDVKVQKAGTINLASDTIYHF